jgi:hypothetical protein
MQKPNNSLTLCCKLNLDAPTLWQSAHTLVLSSPNSRAR